MASYDWIDLTAPEGYAPLAEDLDPEFDPEQVAELLRSQVTDLAKAVLVEHDYVDKDYRSTFYNFYATKGRRYRSDCVRLHFFDGTVRYDEERTNIVSDDGRPQDHYYGYIVLRPTIVATLGRSVLSPRIRRGARGRAIQSVHHVNLLGHRLPVWGFPSMAQHIDIAVCAHVSCWAILRYYSETFPQHREYLVHDITKLVAPFDPGGLVPSLGFSVLGAERVFQAAGCFPVLVGKQNTSEDGFYSQLLAYLESGFPLFVAMNSQRHAVVVVGYDWRNSDVALGPSESSHVWEKIETVLAVDDNLLMAGGAGRDDYGRKYCVLWRTGMNQNLKAYLDKCGRATVDEAKLDELRREMEQAVPEIAESIRQREELAAELRIAASKAADSKDKE